jgi:hypothetical protein
VGEPGELLSLRQQVSLAARNVWRSTRGRLAAVQDVTREIRYTASEFVNAESRGKTGHDGTWSGLT